MTPNDKLPEVISKQIRKEAKEYSKQYSTATSEADWYNGATAWAPWKVKHDELKAENDEVNLRLLATQKLIDKDKAQIALKWARSVIELDELKDKVTDLENELESAGTLILAHEELKEKAQNLAGTLEWIKTYGPCDSRTVKFIDKALQQWKDGKKEVRDGQ